MTAAKSKIQKMSREATTEVKHKQATATEAKKATTTTRKSINFNFYPILFVTM